MAAAEGVEEEGGRLTASRVPVWSHAAKRRSTRYLVESLG